MSDTFDWNYSGQTHCYEDMLKLLTVGLLEESPEEYLELLRRSAQWNLDETRKILNDTSTENGWFSPHHMCLSYLVGDQPDSLKYKASTSSPNRWYGQHLPSLSENLGIEIFEEMIRCGSNLSIKDYYGVDIKYSIEHPPTMLTRENNSRFKDVVLSHYNTQIQ